MPSTTATPWRQPARSVAPTVSAMSTPGVAFSTKTVAANSARSWTPGITV